MYKIGHDNEDEFKKTYKALFSDRLGKINDFKAKLLVKNEATPKFCKSRKIPFELEDAVKLELRKLEAEGIIRSIKYSEWASPIVIVPKPDGQVRICGDFKRTINPFIDTEQYPFPTADELFQKMQGGKKFTKLDLKTAYLQIELDDETMKYLVVNTPDGLKEFTRMPYGITSGPAIFQRKLAMELSHIPMTVVNIDDVLISGKTDEEHFANLHAACDKLLFLGATLNTKKCRFFQNSFEHVGFILSKHGIETNPDKVKAISELPQPKNLKELQSFLGAINYYGKFIRNMSEISAPLYELLQKDTTWDWGTKKEHAFHILKMKLAEAPVLSLYDRTLPIKLSCDASSYGIGAVLSHVYPDSSEKPIAFASRTLTKSENNYSQLDKEALAIMFGVKKFNQYLFGRKFILTTDNKALSHIFNRNAPLPPLAAARLVRWQLTLTTYDYDIELKSTKTHCNADMLSRLPLPSTKDAVSVNAINMFQIDLLSISTEQMLKATLGDRVLGLELKYLFSGTWPNEKDISNEMKPYYLKRDDLSLQDGIILWGLRVVLPYEFRERILAESRYSPNERLK